MFSEKYGFEPKKQILLNDVSSTLRLRIWNVFYQNEILAGGLSSYRIKASMTGEMTPEKQIADRLGLNISNPSLDKAIQKFILECEWYKVYNFMEIYLSCLKEEKAKIIKTQLNKVLEEEKSGYRIIGNEIAPITNPQEIEIIECAGQTPYEAVNVHINKALSLYASKEQPDYENSIKESISAVEAVCCVITGLSGKDATLGKTLKKLKESGVHIHQAMESAFSSLYGYTSDENGIRHGGINFNNAPAEDAKYMLVSCSAFINYLLEKFSKII